MFSRRRREDWNGLARSAVEQTRFAAKRRVVLCLAAEGAKLGIDWPGLLLSKRATRLNEELS
jgi:hypothetical protein